MFRQANYVRALLLTATTSLLVAACGFDGSGGSGGGESGTVDSGTSFTDVSAQIASFKRGNGEGYGGLGWIDYDNDNDLDLMLTNEPGFNNAFFENNGDGSFTDVTSSENGTLVSTGNSGVVVGDIDNDGCADIFMSGTGFFVQASQSATVFLHNQCDGTFIDISSSANVPGAETALSAAFGDINNDGFVDLFVTAQGHLPFGFPPAEQHRDKLYLNNGDLTFTDISVSSGADGGLGSCVATFSHFDDDEYIDLFVGVCNDVTLAATPWHVYKNNGDNTFTDVAETTQLDFGGYWMTSTFGDIDNDGDFDIFSTNLGFTQEHVLWRNNGDGTYVEIFGAATAEVDKGQCRATEADQFAHCWAWGGTFADFDNDYFQDLYFVGELPGVGGNLGKGNPGYMFFNNGNSRFRLAELEEFDLDLEGRGATGLAKADFDNDGFVDFVVMTSGREAPIAPVLMLNNGNGNRSLTIKLEGSCRNAAAEPAPSPCSNRMAIGARVEVVTPNGVYQAREIWAGSSFVSSESPWPVFGLALEESADATVYWPSGLVESFPGLSAGQLHELAEGTGTAL